MPTKKRVHSAEELEAAITRELQSIEAKRARIDSYMDKSESSLSKQVVKAAELAREYNRKRLDPLIDMLIEKGLAYFAIGEGKLIRETDLKIETKTGCETRWRGSEYYEYEETVPYRRTYLKLSHDFSPDGGVLIKEGLTVREAWTRLFRGAFASTTSSDMPGWLLVAIDESKLPPNPIEVLSYSLGGSQIREQQRPGEKVIFSRPGGPNATLVFRRPGDFYKLITSIY